MLLEQRVRLSFTFSSNPFVIIFFLGFETPHNIPCLASSRGICVTDPMLRGKLSEKQKHLWELASQVICFHKPSFRNRQYAVQFSKMTPEHNFVGYHTDSNDIRPQYHVALGSYSGAVLECFDYYGRSHSLLFDKPYLMLKMDGRLGHQVHITNFTGARYTMIFYQMVDENQHSLKPIFFPPKGDGG